MNIDLYYILFKYLSILLLFIMSLIFFILINPKKNLFQLKNSMIVVFDTFMFTSFFFFFINLKNFVKLIIYNVLSYFAFVIL